MARQDGRKISELDVDPSLSGEELVPLVDGSTKRTTTGAIAALASVGGPVAASDVSVSPSVAGQSNAQAALQALESALPGGDQTLSETLAAGNTSGAGHPLLMTDDSSIYLSATGQNQFYSGLQASSNGMVQSHNPYFGVGPGRPVIFQQEVAAAGTVSYEIGGLGNNSFDELAFWLLIVIVDEPYILKYTAFRGSTTLALGALYRDVLVPNVDVDAYTPALQLTVELSGDPNARQLDITNDSAGPITVSLYVQSRGGIFLPTAP